MSCFEGILAFAVKIAVDDQLNSSVVRVERDLGRIERVVAVDVWFEEGLYHTTCGSC